MCRTSACLLHVGSQPVHFGDKSDDYLLPDHSLADINRKILCRMLKCYNAKLTEFDKEQSSRHSLPEVLMKDNGAQYTSGDFTDCSGMGD